MSEVLTCGRAPMLLPPLALTLVALALMSGGSSGALNDTEPPSQYASWEEAYIVSAGELGTPLHIQKNGGGDVDFLNLSFVEPGDMVTIDLEIDDPDIPVELWVSDPERFPVRTDRFEAGGPSALSLRFLAALDGPYFFHLGQSIGDCVVTAVITRTTTSMTGDGNDRPSDAEVIGSTAVKTREADNETDPADFYRLDLAPSNTTKLFLDCTLQGPPGAEVQWELYDSTGIERQGLTYTSDAITVGGSEAFFDRITVADSYHLRVWMREGNGTYRLEVGIVTYPDDGNDVLGDAEPLEDGAVVNGTVHTRYDPLDYFAVDPTGLERIHLWLEVGEDLDLFLLNATGAQRAVSDRWGTETEHIEHRLPPGAVAPYHVLVRPSSELDVEPFRDITYGLRFLSDLPPEVDGAYAAEHGYLVVEEDTVDESLEMDRLFLDPEGGGLTFRVQAGHNMTRLRVSVTPSDRLRVEPAENLSDFQEAVVLEATDDAGGSVTFTLNVTVSPVNDPPQVGHPKAPPPPDAISFDEDTEAGPFVPLFWFWDIDDPLSQLELRVRTTRDLVGVLDGEGQLLLRSGVPDWYGEGDLTVTAQDPGGRWARLTVPVVVMPVNDAPRPYGAHRVEALADDLVFGIDLNGSFLDVEGDGMALRASTGSGISTEVTGGTLVVGDLLPYQHTDVAVVVEAVDVHGAVSDPLDLTLRVGELPDPHALTAHTGERETQEGVAARFVAFGLEDPDPPPRSYTALLRVGEWTGVYGLVSTEVGLAWPRGEPLWTPPVLGEDRDLQVTLSVVDEWYNESVSWTLHVASINHPPRDVAIEPGSPGPYPAGGRLVLAGRAVDDDGDALQFTWHLDGEVAGTGTDITLWDLTPGDHVVTLVVRDAVSSSSARLGFQVVEEAPATGDGVPWTAWALAVVLVLLSLSAVALLLARRR